MKKVLVFIFVVLMIFSTSMIALAAPDSGKGGSSTQTDATKGTVDRNKLLLDKVKGDSDFKIIYDDNAGNYSFTISENSKKTKEEILAKLIDYTAQSYSWNGSLYGYKSLPYSDGKVYSTFSCTVNLSYPDPASDDIVKFNGSSSSLWDGHTPYYASSISQSDKWGVTYTQGTLTISYPPGLGITQSSSSCTEKYPTLTGNYYNYNHSYGTIQFKAYMITDANQTDSAQYRFGTTTISPSCTDYLTLVHG